MEKRKMEVGEKYLKIMVPFGGIDLEFTAFPNRDATPENRQPNFRVAGGGAVWVNKKKEGDKVETLEVL